MYNLNLFKYFCFLLFTVFSVNALADNNYIEERKEIALMRCLNDNYQNLGAYKTNDLKDYSVWTYKLYQDRKVTYDGDAIFSDFIEKNAGNFYKENLLIKSETERPPYNAIFARCMSFYKSKKLNDFLLHHNP